MSANNQLVVAPYPEDLDKYAVWHDGCVDNPFDFSSEPLGVFDKLEEAIDRANKELEDPMMIVEYGTYIILRADITGYEMEVWDEFPDYKYLVPVRRLSDVKPS